MNTDFHQWVSAYKINKNILRKAALELNDGLYEANLGGNVYKKRIPIGNKGKSGGARTLLAFKKDDKAFFIYAFAKSKRANISPLELSALKKLAKLYFSYTESGLKKALKQGELVVIKEKEEEDEKINS